MSRGRFYVLDGVDGSGKTTQAERWIRALTQSGRPEPLHLREPGGTTAGEALRALLLDRATVLCPESETLLFAASRRQMLVEKVAPALEAGRDVVCERFHASTFAYQAIAGGLDSGAVLELLEAWASDPLPDLEIILHVEPGRALQRRGESRDRIEDRGLDYQRAVAEGYRQYVARVERAVLIDGEGSEADVAARIAAAVRVASLEGSA